MPDFITAMKAEILLQEMQRRETENREVKRGKWDKISLTDTFSKESVRSTRDDPGLIKSQGGMNYAATYE